MNCRTVLRKKIKTRDANKKVFIESLRLFIMAGAGVGKSHLMKTICMFLTKTINLYSGSPDKPKVQILEPTGVAAIKRYETTINSGFSIAPFVNRHTLLRFSVLEQARLHNFYSEVSIVLIDEILMVSNICLLHIHKRSSETCGSPESQSFVDLLILVVGDLLQIPSQ